MVVFAFIYDHSEGIGEAEALRVASATLRVQTSRDYTPPPHSLLSADKESYPKGRFQQACAFHDSRYIFNFTWE
jgi:hypothetical protein